MLKSGLAATIIYDQPEHQLLQNKVAAMDVRPDRFVIWPTILACCFPLIVIALWAGPFELAFLGIPLLVMCWAGSALLALAMAIYSASLRQWRRACSMSVLPLAALAVGANAGTLWLFAIDAGERIHFQIMRPSYLADLSKLPPADEPRFEMWRWGGFGVGHAVVYDESDEIALPQQSVAWKKRTASTEVGLCGARGRTLENHFYLVRTGC